MPGKKGHRGWGWIRQSGRRPPKRWHASYIGADSGRHKAPNTFGAKMDAEAWLAAERRLIDLNIWTPPSQREAEKTARGITLTEYGPTWIEQRTVAGEPLKPRTRSHYERLFEEHIKSAPLGAIPLANITTTAVRTWHASTLIGRPTYRSHCYGLLHAMLATAVTDGYLSVNPAQITGAGSATSKKQAVVLDVAEVGQLADTIDERFKALILISAWLGTRYGRSHGASPERLQRRLLSHHGRTWRHSPRRQMRDRHPEVKEGSQSRHSPTHSPGDQTPPGDLCGERC